MVNNDVNQANPNANYPILNRVGQCFGSLVLGGMAGYFCYGITWLVYRSGTQSISPKPYILAGVVSAAITETGCLIYDAALYTIGERQKYENLNFAEKATSFDRFRQCSWKVITFVEGLQHRVDLVYSRIFFIRSSKEIRENKIFDRDLYFMEIFRRALGAQVHDTIKFAIPQDLGLDIVAACGFTLIREKVFFWFRGIIFLGGLAEKIMRVYQQIDLEKHSAFERKHYFDMLPLMYPDEFNEFEKQKAQNKAVLNNEKKNGQDLVDKVGGPDIILKDKPVIDGNLNAIDDDEKVIEIDQKDFEALFKNIRDVSVGDLKSVASV